MAARASVASETANEQAFHRRLAIVAGRWTDERADSAVPSSVGQSCWRVAAGISAAPAPPTYPMP